MKKSYQSSIVGLSLSNQIISITITGDFMILFMSQILGFSDLQNSWLITMLPIIALVRIPLSYLMRRKNLLDLMRWSVLSKLCLIAILVVIPYERVTFSIYTVFLVLYQITVELGFGLVWNPLILLVTEEKSRAKFLSHLGLFQLVTSFYTLLISFYIGKELTSFHYRCLLGIALVSLILQFILLKQLQTDYHLFQNHQETGRMDWQVLKKQIWHHLRILLLDSLILYITLTMNVLYMVQVLHLSANLVSLYSSMSLLGNVLALALAGPCFEKRRSLFFTILLLVTGCEILLIFFLPHDAVSYTIFWSIGWGLLNGAVGALWGLYISLVKHQAASPNPFTIWNIYQGIAYLVSVLVFYLSGNLVHLSSSSSEFDPYRLVLIACLSICILVCLRMLYKRKTGLK
jgi:membrane protein